VQGAGFGQQGDLRRRSRRAAGLLEAEYNADGKMRGDIALITDGVRGVTEEWMRAWNERKAALGFRVFGIAIGRQPSGVMDALSDNVRTIDAMTDPGRSCEPEARIVGHVHEARRGGHREPARDWSTAAIGEACERPGQSAHGMNPQKATGYAARRYLQAQGALRCLTASANVTR